MSNPRMYPRTLGLFTLAYGIFTAVRPLSLVRAAGLEPAAGAPSPSGRALGHLIGARDALSGLSMLTAPPGPALQAAVAARVAFDVSDVVGFVLAVPPRSRTRVLAVAGGWGLLCASSYRAAGRA